MERRRLLQISAGTCLTIGLGAGTAVWFQLHEQPLGFAAVQRDMFAILANVLLDGSLPVDPALRQRAIVEHVRRVELTVAGLPPHARVELGQLLMLLTTRLGRLALMGIADHWAEMKPSQLADALDRMRRSSLALRQQIYLALRELTMAAFYADPTAWRLLGYPGPSAI